jgi:hypothetical protein
MANYFTKAHDIGITDPSTGDIIGLCISRVEGKPQWFELDGKHLLDLYGTNVPNQTYVNPEEELPFIQTDWRAGFGLEYQDTNDPYRYFKSTGMDLRFRGSAMLSPTPTAVTTPAITTLNVVFRPNAEGSTQEFASTTGSAHYTEVDEVTADNATSRVYTSGSDAHLEAYDLYGIPVHPSYISGVINSITVYIRAMAVSPSSKYSECKSVIRTHDTTYYGDANALTSTTYATKSHTWTVNPNTSAAFTWAEIDAMEIGGWVHGGWEGSVSINLSQVLMVVNFTPTTIPASLSEYNDALYLGRGNALSKLNDTGTAFTEVKSDFKSPVTDLEPFSDDNLYIAQGITESYYQMDTAEAFTQNTLANNMMQFMRMVRTTADTMYGNDAVNTLRSTTNPADGGDAWSSITTVGSSYHNINGLLSFSGAAYIPKEDTIYYLDSDGVVQDDLAPQLKALTASTSGQNAEIGMDGYITYPAGDQGLFKIGSTVEKINPAGFTTNNSDYNGRVMACAHDDDYDYIAVDNSTKVEILATREETLNGYTRRVYHPICELTMAGVACMEVSTVYQKRLWIVSTSAADNIYYIPLYTGVGDVTSDANRKFQTGGTFETPWLHGDFRGDLKAWTKLTLTMTHTYNAGRYFTVSYKKLGDSSWTEIGDFDGSATSMVESKYIPVDGSSYYPVSTMLKFKFEGVTDDTDYTPVLADFKVHAVLQPLRKKIILAKITTKDNNLTLRGPARTSNTTLKTTCLENMRTPGWFTTIQERFSVRDAVTTHYVKLLELPQSMQWRSPLDAQDTHSTEWEYTLLMLVVPIGGDSGSLPASSSSSTDNAVARFDGTDGRHIQNSGVIVDDSDNVSGIANITLTGTVDGRDIATDGTKLDGIAEGADVTADNAPQAHAASHASGSTDPLKLDDLALPDDNTDLNASASAHGLLLKLENTGLKYLRDDGTWTLLSGGGDMLRSVYDPTDILASAFDTDNHVSGTTNKVYTATEQTKLSGIDTGADVTADNAPKAHAASHKSGGSDAIKLDELAAPTDVTTLDVSTSAHGLAPKLSNTVTEFLNGQGGWTTPDTGPSTFVALTDTPANFTAAGGYFVKVNATPDALEFVSPANTLASLSGEAAAAFDFNSQNLTGLGTLSAFTLAGTLSLGGQEIDAGAGDLVVQTTGSQKGLRFICTRDGSVNGEMRFVLVSATPEDGDNILRISAYGYNDNTPADVKRYGLIVIESDDVSNGAEDGKFSINLINNGAANVALTLSGEGVLAVDLGGSGSAAQVDLFDDYDDAVALKEGIQQNNRELLADMGILERKTGGYMMKLQPMIRLLAGGIYQNRELLENKVTMLEERINALQLAGG